MRKAAEILKEMDGIVARAENESRPMTVEETAEFDRLKVEYDAAVVAESDAQTRLTSETQSRRNLLAAAHAEASRAVVAPAARRYTAPGDPANKEFETLEQFCAVAILRPNDSRLEFVRRDPASQAQYDEFMGGAQAEQRMDTGSAGGFLIPQQFRQQIMAVAAEGSIVRSRATVIPAGSPPDAEITMPALDQTGSAPENMFGGVSVSWIAEGGAKPETDADFRQISLKPNEVAGHIVLTDKALRNSAALGAFVAQVLPSALGQAEELAFISGDGVGKPKGFRVSAARYSQARASGGNITYADLVNMLSRLLGNGVWIISKAAMPEIAQIQDNSGGSPGVGAYVFNPTMNTLFGLPVIWIQRGAAALGAEGDVSLADLSYYLIKDGSGPFIAASEHVHFTSNKTVVKAFTNVDGDCWLTEPFTGEDGREYSPFVVLAA